MYKVYMTPSPIARNSWRECSFNEPIGQFGFIFLMMKFQIWGPQYLKVFCPLVVPRYLYCIKRVLIFRRCLWPLNSIELCTTQYVVNFRYHIKFVWNWNFRELLLHTMWFHSSISTSALIRWDEIAGIFVDNQLYIKHIVRLRAIMILMNSPK